MKRNSTILAAALTLIAASSSHAGDGKIDPQAALAALGNNSLQSLAGNLRGLLIGVLPSPLYSDETHWGQQKMAPDGVTVKGKGLDVHLEPRLKAKNHGSWWRVHVTSSHLADTLVFDLRDVQQPEPGRMLFTAFVSFDVDVEYERQTWDEGLRLYSSSVRARMRIKMTLQCEATSRVEKKGGLLTDVVFRLRVVKANCGYDNFVVEHVAGIGGEAAKVIGDAARGTIKQWYPSLEKRLLEKADAALVKAADTKDVRLSLTNLFGAKK